MMTDRLDEHLLPASLAPALWSAFDADWYARACPEAAGRGFAASRAHYLTEGQAAGVSPVRYFDEGWYRAAYPDVAAGIAAGTWRSGFEHYCLEGHADRAPNMLFDNAYYPTLTDGALREAACFNRYDHFLKIGAAAGLSGHPLFDAAFYAAAAGVAPGEAFAHFLDALRFGPAEPAPSAYFDPAWYLAFHPAAAAAVTQRRFRGALHHYLRNETPVAFDPVPDFSEMHYLAETPEAALLVSAGVFRNGYAHFLARGAAAQRSPAPWIDLGFYVARHPDAAPAPFRHLLTTGQAHGLRTAPQAANEASGVAMLPLLARGRLDFMLRSPPALTAIVLMPADRAQALAALGVLQGAAAGGVELFLLDWNGEAAGLAALVGGARVLAYTPGQRAMACNTAVASSAGHAVLLLDGAAVPTATGLMAGMQRLANDPSAGVVGGPLVGADGRLIEAGAVVAADGSMRSHLRGAPAQIAEAGFVREVDGFRSTQVLIRRSLLDALGGFAEDRPDSEVAMDLCLRAWQAGYRAIYDPAMAVAVPGARKLRVAGLPSPPSPGLAARHAAYLRRARAPAGAPGAARIVRTGVELVLLVVPHMPNDNDEMAVRISGLVGDGAEVTLYPLDGGPADPAMLPPFLPETVEIVCGPGEAGLPAFLSARGETYFNRIVMV